MLFYVLDLSLDFVQVWILVALEAILGEFVGHGSVFGLGAPLMSI